MTTTVNYSWALPTVGASVNTWGTLVNNILIDIDANMFARTGGTISGNLGLGVAPDAWHSGQKAININASGALYGSAGSDVNLTSNAYINSAGTQIYRQTNLAAKYNLAAGNHYWSTAPSGTAGNAISWTQSLALGKGTTLVLEGATSAAGTGIAFPATQSASSDANTLDDYEEGTWTPAVNLLGTLTYGAQNGSYTKIGRQVTVTFQVVVSSTDTTQDAVPFSISGFPFAAASGSFNSKALTEAVYGSSSVVRTFYVFLTSGSSASVQAEQWNGPNVNGSYYSSITRAAYKGGNMIFNCSLTYII